MTTVTVQRGIHTETVPPRMTYKEFLDWLDEHKHAEWVNGKVIMHSPVSRGHIRIGRFFIRLLDAYNDEYDAGELFYEPFLMKIGEEFPGRAPDLMFVKNENLLRVERNVLNGPADLIIEIISPESRSRDRGDKFYEYEAGGVAEYALIDPDCQTVEYYRRNTNGHYQVVLPGAEGRLHSDVLHGFYFYVSWLWQNPFPPLRSILADWSRTEFRSVRGANECRR